MPACSTALRRHRFRRRAIGAALALTVAAGLTGCDRPDESEGAGATADGLLALTAARAGDEPALTGWVGSDAAGVNVALPHGRTTWISVGRGDVLAATVEKTGLAISDPLHIGKRLVWRFVDAEDPNGSVPEGPAYFATWDPSGGVVAQLSGDLASGDGVSVLLIGPSDGSALTIPMDRSVLGAPPAWVAADRLVVVAGEAGALTSAIVDTTDGTIADGPDGARLVATSANLARVATMAGPGEPVVIRDLDRWLAGDTATLGSVEPPDGASTAAAFALDTSGQRLAVAWIAADGSIDLAVHDGRSGWRRTASPEVGAIGGAALAWTR